MRPRVHVVTLGVADIERSLGFYRRLGWGPGAVVGTEFEATAESPGGAAGQLVLEDGLLLMFYGRHDLERDAGTALSPGPGPFSLGHLVESRAAVDEALQAAVDAGGTLADAAHERPWGIYSGYFQDPDGHLWEVISNPASGPEAEA